MTLLLAASVQDDPVALAEIDLCGELMIAAATSAEERLSFARIDEVLEVARTHPGPHSGPQPLAQPRTRPLTHPRPRPRSS
jgi:hypothetical protein